MKKRKHLALVLLVLVISMNFVIPPKHADAIFGIGDFGVTVDLVQENIKLILNTAAHSLARKIVSKLVNSTVTWANSGFNGNPVFVQNPKQFLADAANQTAQSVVDGVAHGRYGFLCSPFQKSITLSLVNYYTVPDNQELQCTWTGVSQNLDSFLKGNFSAGGWKGWFSMTQVPTNNVYQATVQAEIDLSAATAKAIGVQQTQYTKSGGFLDTPGDCILYNPKSAGLIQNYLDGDPTELRPYIDGEGSNPSLAHGDTRPPYDQSKGRGECIERGPSKTPGSIIQSELSNTLASGLNQIVTAKDWDEVVGALVNGLTTKVFNSAAGLFTNNATKGLANGNETSGITYNGPTSKKGGGPIRTSDQISCSANMDTAFVIDAKPVTWSVVSSLDGVTEFGWTGDEIENANTYDKDLGYATSTKIQVTYATATSDDTPFKTMVLTASTTDTLGRHSVIGPIDCSDQITVNNYHPLAVSCSPKNNVLHAAPEVPVIWIATISGGSGKFVSLQWDGQQGHVPGSSNDLSRMWPHGDTTLPHINWAWSGSGKTGSTTQDNTQVTTSSGIITTSTLTRIYLRDKDHIGDVDASLEVIDKDPATAVVNQRCDGTIHIDD